jgi:hypothetical protein
VARRRLPDPGEPVPQVAEPTVALFGASLAVFVVFVVMTVAYATAHAPAWLTVAAGTAVSFAYIHYASHAPWSQLPLRWPTIDAWYTRTYLPRPRAEWGETVAVGRTRTQSPACRGGQVVGRRREVARGAARPTTAWTVPSVITAVGREA